MSETLIHLVQTLKMNEYNYFNLIFGRVKHILTRKTT